MSGPQSRLWARKPKTRPCGEIHLLQRDWPRAAAAQSEGGKTNESVSNPQLAEVVPVHCSQVNSRHQRFAEQKDSVCVTESCPTVRPLTTTVTSLPISATTPLRCGLLLREIP